MVRVSPAPVIRNGRTLGRWEVTSFAVVKPPEKRVVRAPTLEHPANLIGYSAALGSTLRFGAEGTDDRLAAVWARSFPS